RPLHLRESEAVARGSALAQILELSMERLGEVENRHGSPGERRGRLDRSLESVTHLAAWGLRPVDEARHHRALDHAAGKAARGEAALLDFPGSGEAAGGERGFRTQAMDVALMTKHGREPR